MKKLIGFWLLVIGIIALPASSQAKYFAVQNTMNIIGESALSENWAARFHLSYYEGTLACGDKDELLFGYFGLKRSWGESNDGMDSPPVRAWTFFSLGPVRGWMGDDALLLVSQQTLIPLADDKFEVFLESEGYLNVKDFDQRHDYYGIYRIDYLWRNLFAGLHSEQVNHTLSFGPQIGLRVGPLSIEVMYFDDFSDCYSIRGQATLEFK